MTTHPYSWCDHIDHDAFGELDLSSSGVKSGAIGCMVRRLTDLNRRERQLLTELEDIQRTRAVAMAALDRFISQDNPAPAQAGNQP